jgi:hypothetical protein
MRQYTGAIRRNVPTAGHTGRTVSANLSPATPRVRYPKGDRKHSGTRFRLTCPNPSPATADAGQPSCVPAQFVTMRTHQEPLVSDGARCSPGRMGNALSKLLSTGGPVGLHYRGWCELADRS